MNIDDCEGCGIRRPVNPEDGRCLACRDRLGLLEPDQGGAIATDGGEH